MTHPLTTGTHTSPHTACWVVDHVQDLGRKPPCHLGMGYVHVPALVRHSDDEVLALAKPDELSVFQGPPGTAVSVQPQRLSALRESRVRGNAQPPGRPVAVSATQCV